MRTIETWNGSASVFRPKFAAPLPENFARNLMAGKYVIHSSDESPHEFDVMAKATDGTLFRVAIIAFASSEAKANYLADWGAA